MKIFTRIISEQYQSNNIQPLHIELSFDDRKRARFKGVSLCGKNIGIQIARGCVIRDDTWLESSDGSLLRVLAAHESVSSAYIDDPNLFARASYHLGNRHVSLQIEKNFLRYQSDYVLDAMLNQLGIKVVQETAIFEPENGAYFSDSGHHNSHSHSHSHAEV